MDESPSAEVTMSYSLRSIRYRKCRIESVCRRLDEYVCVVEPPLPKASRNEAVTSALALAHVPPHPHRDTSEQTIVERTGFVTDAGPALDPAPKPLRARRRAQRTAPM